MAFCLCFIISHGQKQNTYLIINPQGHRSTVYDAVLDNKGNLVTGSFDKTIKVWNLNQGSEIRSFRGEIGPGSEGMIYTVSLSPDNKYLAAAGWLGSDDETEALGDIRIYDYTTGDLYTLLEYHENALMDLSFTPHGTLISGDADGNIVEWDVENKRGIHVYYAKDYDFGNIAVCEDYFVTGHHNGMAYVWNYGKEKPVKKINFFAKKKLSMIIDVNVSVSPSGDFFTVCGKDLGMVLIFNRKMKLADYFFTGDNEVIKTSFSPSGNRLILSIKDPGNNHVLVYENKDGKWTEISKFKKHNDLVLAVGFVDEKTCYSAGGERNEIFTWKITKPEKIRSSSQSNGTSFYSGGLNGSELAYSRTPNKAIGFADYTSIFDIFSRSTKKIENPEKFDYPKHELGAYRIYSKYAVRTSTYDPNENLYIRKNNRLVDSIPRYYWDGNGHNAYTLVDQKHLITAGDYGIMEAYSTNGMFRGKFVGHEDGIRSVNLSSDKEFIISAGLDMTLRIWRTKDIGIEKENPNLMSIWEYCEFVEVEETYHPIINSLGLSKDARRRDVQSWRKVIKGLEDADYPCSFMKMRLSGDLYKDIYPVVSIFIAENGEWVVWNNDGYFTSSKRGAKYVGYHINQGKNKAAKFYPFEQFDLKYNRPDIIMGDLNFADAGIIDIYKRAYQKRLERSGIDEENFNNYEIHVPIIQIKKYTSEGAEAHFDVTAKDTKFQLDRVNVYLNDVPIYGRKGVSIAKEQLQEIHKNFEIELITGMNKIQFSVLNEKGVESLRETVFIEHESTSKGELYVAAIGVSEFQDKNYNLNYAAKDAIDVIELMKGNKGYENINTLLFINQEVTKSTTEAVQAFFARAKTGDVVLLYIAGHGVLSQKLDYYYATYNMDFNNPELNGISYADLEAIFDKISSIKKLLIMDTCHSGDLNRDELEEITHAENNVDSDIVFRSSESTATIRERKGLKVINEMMKEMFNEINKGTGTTVISSAGGVEFAFESEKWKNGLFTYCLLNGLSSKKADANKDGKIYLSELQSYISIEVAKLSNGLQTPTARLENISLDYLIWN